MIARHEAGHCVVATALGYQAGAVVAGTKGRTFRPFVTDPVHRAAIGVVPEPTLTAWLALVPLIMRLKSARAR